MWLLMYLSHCIMNTSIQNNSYRTQKATATAVLTVVFFTPLQSFWKKSEFISLSFFLTKQCYQHIIKTSDHFGCVKRGSLFIKFYTIRV